MMTKPNANPEEEALARAHEGAGDPISPRLPAEAIRHFKTSEVVDLLDLSRRQLQYWAKTRLVEPSARTPGGHHRYDFNDLVALKATKRLIDAGVSVQKIRKSVGALRHLLPQVGRPLSELVLVATGDVVLVFHDETVFEAITGQEWVFPVAAFEREVSAFRVRQETDARLRHEAEMRLRRGASTSGAEDRSGSRRSEAGRRPSRRAPIEPIQRSVGDRESGIDSDGRVSVKPTKPSVRGAGQGRKRLGRTG
ncbi:MerR family transcriptional regulator [Myxococcota bacterium]|nr:MerR family transcriptional regulator [Myxococcota bacterium]